MRTPCLFWAEVVSPGLRAKIAKNLYERGFTQSQIAEKLGITQAMVSKYIGGKYKPLSEKVEGVIEELAAEISNMIAYGAPEEDVIKYTSRRFFDLIRGELCEEYLKYANLGDPTLCSEIFGGMVSKAEILDVLNLALGELLKDERFLDLIPEVRSNFAYAIANPRGIEDVAAIPGRITRVKGKAFALPPEFGASEHMAKILIELSRKAFEIRSVINIKLDENVEAALKKAGLKFAVIEEKNRDEERTVELIGDIFEEHGMLDAVVDRGAFGMEPCVYIFGKNPLEVLDKVKALESCI